MVHTELEPVQGTTQNSIPHADRNGVTTPPSALVSNHLRYHQSRLAGRLILPAFTAFSVPHKASSHL